MHRLGVLASLALLACGGGDPSDVADAGLAPDSGASVCTHSGMSPNAQAAERDDELGVLFYTATSGQAPDLERLTFDFYFTLGATDGPQNLVFDGENLRDCHTCLVARRECDSANCASGKAFLVQEGTAAVTTMGSIGTPFQGTISDAVFAEVTINAGNLETILVPGGETWCMDEFTFDASISAP